MKQTKKLILVTVLAFFMAGLTPRVALSDVTEEERDLSFLVDVSVLRPVGFVTTLVGVVLFVATLPIAIPTLSVEKSFDILVTRPAAYTFARELGGEDYGTDVRREQMAKDSDQK